MKVSLPLRLFNLTLFAFLLVPLTATASDDERRGKREGGEYKEKFRDGNCKVAREWKEGKFKEERECEEKDERQNYPSRRATVRPAPVMVYPPWVLYEQGRPVYRPGREPQPVSNQEAVYCNSESVGRVIGGVAGAVLGNQVGTGDGRILATVGGLWQVYSLAATLAARLMSIIRRASPKRWSLPLWVSVLSGRVQPTRSTLWCQEKCSSAGASTAVNMTPKYFQMELGNRCAAPHADVLMAYGWLRIKGVFTYKLRPSSLV